jgi:hypothetical protein
MGFAVSGIILTTASTAQTTTYTYTGQPFGSNVLTPQPCPFQGSFTTKQPIASNLDFSSVVPAAFTFTNCISTITNSNATFASFSVGTDGEGHFISYEITLQAPATVQICPATLPNGGCFYPNFVEFKIRNTDLSQPDLFDYCDVSCYYDDTVQAGSWANGCDLGLAQQPASLR